MTKAGIMPIGKWSGIYGYWSHGEGSGGGLTEAQRILKEGRFHFGLDTLKRARSELEQTTDVAERTRLRNLIDRLEEELERLAIELEQ